MLGMAILAAAMAWVGTASAVWIGVQAALKGNGWHATYAGARRAELKEHIRAEPRRIDRELLKHPAKRRGTRLGRTVNYGMEGWRYYETHKKLNGFPNDFRSILESFEPNESRQNFALYFTSYHNKIKRLDSALTRLIQAVNELRFVEDEYQVGAHAQKVRTFVKDILVHYDHQRGSDELRGHKLIDLQEMLLALVTALNSTIDGWDTIARAAEVHRGERSVLPWAPKQRSSQEEFSDEEDDRERREAA